MTTDSNAPACRAVGGSTSASRPDSAGRRAAVLAATLWVACGLFAASPPAQATKFNVDILSPDFYPGIPPFEPTLINDRGVLAGFINTWGEEPYRPAIYLGAGQVRTLDLESSDFYPNKIVAGFNNRGVLVGNLTDPNGASVPYVYRNGKVSHPSAAGYELTAEGLNDRQWVYGNARDLATGRSGVYLTKLGPGADFRPLALDVPEAVSFKTGPEWLNNQGLLGFAAYSADSRYLGTYLYDSTSGGLTRLEPPTGYSGASLGKITNSGLIIGRVAGSYATWNADGSFRGLFESPEYTGLSFNNRGQAVGMNVFTWDVNYFDGKSWSVVDFPTSEGYTALSVASINDRGQFVGRITDPHLHLASFIATPVPEPATAILFVLGAGGLCAGFARRRAARPAAALR